MATYRIRPFDPTKDYRAFVALFNTQQTEERTLEQWLNHDAVVEGSGPPLHRNDRGQICGVHSRRWVVENTSGATVGAAHFWRAQFVAPGELIGQVAVEPTCYGQGIGTQLAVLIEQEARALGAERIKTSVRDDQPAWLTFAERYGYRVDHQEFESTLRVSDFDPAPFAGVIERVEASGIRFCSLAERPGEATERALMAVEQSTAQDDPGHFAGEIDFPTWRRLLLEPKGVTPEGIILAWDEDRLVGTTMMTQYENGALYTLHTGVEREYRGRSIALALKLLAIREAERRGAPYMRTNNDSRNAPMLAVNRRLGYRSEPGRYHLVNQLQ